jgi:hypothetical protein
MIINELSNASTSAQTCPVPPVRLNRAEMPRWVRDPAESRVRQVGPSRPRGQDRIRWLKAEDGNGLADSVKVIGRPAVIGSVAVEPESGGWI